MAAKLREGSAITEFVSRQKKMVGVYEGVKQDLRLCRRG
jgi:hypothetical protein